MENGKPFAWVSSTTQLQQKNLTWSANCTHDITNIVFISPAPAHLRQ